MKVIIIGAGAAGLVAANELVRHNIAVTVLEAENRIGGRIQTFVPEGFTNHVEAGAEFIHGNLPLTLRFMKKAKMGYIPSGGKMCRFKNGKMYSNFSQTKAWDEFYEAISNAKHDLSVAALLERDFSSKKYEMLTAEVRSMAQGLDLADIEHLSVFSIREEWVSEEPQFRPLGGYSALLEFLHTDAASAQYQLFLREKVQAIQWRAGYAQVQTQNSLYEADAVIVTVPLPLLQNDAIAFSPAIDSMNRQFAEIGFGEVIKFTLEFEYAFWEKQHPDLGFLFADDGFTFWTQLSEHRPVLTGWLGNDYAQKYSNTSDADLLHAAISKLQPIFNSTNIGKLYKAGAVFRYIKESVWGGGYSWMTTKSKSAIGQVKKGIGNTLFFAGEAFDDGGNIGTVEAAFNSGRYAARKILKLKNH